MGDRCCSAPITAATLNCCYSSHKKNSVGETVVVVKSCLHEAVLRGLQTREVFLHKPVQLRALDPFSLADSWPFRVHKSPQRSPLRHRLSKVNTAAHPSPRRQRQNSRENCTVVFESPMCASRSRREAGMWWLCDSVREVPECSSDSFSDCPPSAISSFSSPSHSTVVSLFLEVVPGGFAIILLRLLGSRVYESAFSLDAFLSLIVVLFC